MLHQYYNILVTQINPKLQTKGSKKIEDYHNWINSIHNLKTSTFKTLQSSVKIITMSDIFNIYSTSCACQIRLSPDRSCFTIISLHAIVLTSLKPILHKFQRKWNSAIEISQHCVTAILVRFIPIILCKSVKLYLSHVWDFMNFKSKKWHFKIKPQIKGIPCVNADILILI